MGELDLDICLFHRIIEFVRLVSLCQLVLFSIFKYKLMISAQGFKNPYFLSLLIFILHEQLQLILKIIVLIILNLELFLMHIFQFFQFILIVLMHGFRILVRIIFSLSAHFVKCLDESLSLRCF